MWVKNKPMIFTTAFGYYGLCELEPENNTITLLSEVKCLTCLGQLHQYKITKPLYQETTILGMCYNTAITNIWCNWTKMAKCSTINWKLNCWSSYLLSTLTGCNLEEERLLDLEWWWLHPEHEFLLSEVECEGDWECVGDTLLSSCLLALLELSCWETININGCFYYSVVCQL